MLRTTVAPALALLALLAPALAGCTAAPAPRATVTVTASPRPTPLGAAEAAPYDLPAVCALEGSALTALSWRTDEGRRISAATGRGVLAAVAAQYLGLAGGPPIPDSVRADVDALAAASGSLEHPSFGPEAPAVLRAQAGLAKACQDAGSTIAVFGQGG